MMNRPDLLNLSNPTTATKENILVTTQLTRKLQSRLYNDYTPLKMDTEAQRHPVASPMPTIELYSRKDISFLHPGYEALNVLLRLPRVDRTSSGSFGVCHRTALLACQVIANNAFETGY